MSCRLLLSPENVPHTLADDLESFLHVLSWVALLYTSHALGPAELSHDVTRVFEASWTDAGLSYGGASKQEFLVAGSITKSGFHNLEMVALLRTLTATFAARYMVPPTITKYTDQIKRDLIPLRTQELQEQLQSLETSEYVLATFEAALEDRQAWPLHDKSKPNLQPQTQPRGLKRSWDQICETGGSSHHQ
jgi:hypothetical protein